MSSPMLIDKNGVQHKIRYYLCDTGCNLNLIKDTYLKRIRKKLSVEVIECNEEFTSVDPKAAAMKSRAMCVLTAKLNERKVKDIFYVITGMDMNIIFGSELMTECGFALRDENGLILNISNHPDFKIPN